MSVITSIKPQKNQKRVNIYLDDKFAFGLDLENFMKLGLKVGYELSDESAKEIVKKSEFQSTYDKLLKFATLRPRSEKEINLWIKKHKVHKSLQKGLFNRLNRLNLVNDYEFAKWWIGQRLQFKFKSKKELIYELQAKGVNKNTIEDVLSEIEVDEEKSARRLLEKRKYKWERLPKLDAKRKMSEFLGRKGFGWDVIKKVTKDLMDRNK